MEGQPALTFKNWLRSAVLQQPYACILPKLSASGLTRTLELPSSSPHVSAPSPQYCGARAFEGWLRPHFPSSKWRKYSYRPLKRSQPR